VSSPYEASGWIAQLNGLAVWSTDAGNAYLESYTKEKVCIVAGPEFAPFGLEGHILLIDRALYGLKSSGLRWWESLADIIHDPNGGLGFFRSKAETDIWMRHKGDHYEMIGVYVDDLIIISKNPQPIIDCLTTMQHKFTLKGTSSISYHLGCDYFYNLNGNYHVLRTQAIH
jgi:Reverse transcriptase (RNA-dependent DNA polymerase)